MTCTLHEACSSHEAFNNNTRKTGRQAGGRAG
eukprot:CAMPEP_0206601754 /NCGR_PEP_ID=MMETSP0325_2-20121206/46855_1 /ASSEMBLY_ACC=CAM_ASM_000347 /TAXON_ID=2866 /ORGANISM="Crypthecodinium cohnii, Strain Seligo" /LENGTH=31 /DNA_ID= /DNA_START= /DNA_END= /DNA_ORIENTATION=